MPAVARVSALRVAAALGAVYLIWGSTYLAIRVVGEVMPPLLSAGARFVVAGAVLLGVSRRAGAVTAAHWWGALVVGGLLFAVGNAGVVLGAQTVDSGLVALVLTLVPAFMVLIDWGAARGARPSLPVALAIVGGFFGVALVARPGDGGVDPAGVVILVVASVGWAAGSVLAPRVAAPASALQAAGLQLLVGGVLEAALGLSLGEAASFEPAAVTPTAVAALLYLTVFGTLVAYTAYVWLLQVASTALVATHAYVNPVVAIALGWLVLGEPVTWRTLIATVVIVAAVAVIGRHQGASHQREGAQAGEDQLVQGTAQEQGLALR